MLLVHKHGTLCFLEHYVWKIFVLKPLSFIIDSCSIQLITAWFQESHQSMFNQELDKTSADLTWFVSYSFWNSLIGELLAFHVEAFSSCFAVEYPFFY